MSLPLPSSSSSKATDNSTKPSSTAVANTNRKRKCSDPLLHGRQRQRRRSRELLTSTQQQQQQQGETSTNVETVKSIVGLRPTHWSRRQNSRTVLQHKRGGDDSNFNSNSNSTTRDDSTSTSTQQLANASALAAATRTPFRKPLQSTRTKTKTKKRANTNTNDTVSRTKSTAATSGDRCRDRSSSPSKTKTPTTDEAVGSSFSFAPAFVPTKNKVLVEDTDAIGDDDGDWGDGCRVVTVDTTTPNSNSTSLFPSSSTTPPSKWRRRAKKTTATGEWVRKLVTLRNARNNDSVRLQNQAFVRERQKRIHHKTLLDVNDPRKRARTYTDATILGRYDGPWINLPEDTKITVLGYAHRRIRIQQPLSKSQTNNHPTTNANAKAKANTTTTTTLSQNFFAWFTFTLATARRIELQQMCTLRIYNAVVLPCRLVLPVTLDLPPDSRSILPELVSDSDASSGTRQATSTSTSTIRCEKTVVCTQLCERTN
uniref:Uncharacterized protein n=1 Tax=Pseudo-nitzschia australis TaxID=44445 RepID=A0A7S4EM70_9STRA